MKKIIMISAMVMLPVVAYCLGTLVGKSQAGLYCTALMAMNNVTDLGIINRQSLKPERISETFSYLRQEDLKINIIKYGRDADSWLLTLPSIIDYNDASKRIFKPSVKFYLSNVSPDMTEILQNPQKTIDKVRRDLQLEGDFNEQAFSVWEMEFLEEIDNFNRAIELTKSE